jgi:hypothetical protein
MKMVLETIDHVKSKLASAWTVLSALVIVLLLSCGGGGGGGGTAAGPSVSVALSDPSQIQATVMAEGAMPDVRITGSASGDLKSLAGKVIYVIVEDPDSLFVHNTALSFDPGSTAGSYSIVLPGTHLMTPGQYRGNLKIHVALDVNLSQELGNSPLRIPYDVTVLPGLTIGQQTLAVDSIFGDATATRTIPVSLPASVTTWAVENTTPYNPQPLVWSPSIVKGPGDAVSISLYPAPPGTYTYTFRVTASAQPPGGTLQEYGKDITVTYTIGANGSVDYVVAPQPAIHAVMKYGDPLTKPFSYMIIPNTGVADTLLGGIEYLANPPTAASNPIVNAWWFNDQSIATCQGSDILPVGTYTARMRHTLSKGGTLFDIYYPIELTIEP